MYLLTSVLHKFFGCFVDVLEEWLHHEQNVRIFAEHGVGLVSGYGAASYSSRILSSSSSGHLFLVALLFLVAVVGWRGRRRRAAIEEIPPSAVEVSQLLQDQTDGVVVQKLKASPEQEEGKCI